MFSGISESLLQEQTAFPEENPLQPFYQHGNPLNLPGNGEETEINQLWGILGCHPGEYRTMEPEVYMIAIIRSNPDSVMSRLNQLRNGITLMNLCAIKGFSMVIRELLKFGANRTHSDSFLRNPLMYAYMFPGLNHQKVREELLVGLSDQEIGCYLQMCDMYGLDSRDYFEMYILQSNTFPEPRFSPDI